MKQKDLNSYHRFYADAQKDKSGMCLVGLHQDNGVSIWDNSDPIVCSRRISNPREVSLKGWYLCPNMSEAETFVSSLLRANVGIGKTTEMDTSVATESDPNDASNDIVDGNKTNVAEYVTIGKSAHTKSSESLAPGFNPPADYNYSL
jgi:hypothetical protein